MNESKPTEEYDSCLFAKFAAAFSVCGHQRSSAAILFWLTADG